MIHKREILTKKEQTTTTAYKFMKDKVEKLEASLKKTQDGNEKIINEKFELEKRNILLEEKMKKRYFITFLEFISTAAFGFALSYIPQGNYSLVFSIGIPSGIIYLICLYLTKI